MSLEGREWAQGWRESGKEEEEEVGAELCCA